MTRGIAPDLRGKRFGHLVATERAPSDKQSNAQWFCKCDCGKTATVRATFLTKGQIVCSKACPLSPARQIKDIAGQSFGSLLAVSHKGFNAARQAIWLFHCTCGNKIAAPSARVLNSGMRTCGKGVHASSYKHGLSKTRGYKSMHFHKYMGAKSGRTPKWLTDDQIAQMAALYVEAEKLTKSTGTMHEVDHYYPLQGRLVSGLHVPSNLRILTRTENRKKTNKLPDDVC